MAGYRAQSMALCDLVSLSKTLSFPLFPPQLEVRGVWLIDSLTFSVT